MKRSVRIFCTLAVVLSVAAFGVAAWAATPPMSVTINRSGHAVLEGTIASISGSTIMVNSWGGQWSVDTASAKLVRRFGGASNIGEFIAGDQVTITGTAGASAWQIKAKTIKNLSIQQLNVSPTGLISNTNVSNNTFDLTTGGKTPKTYHVLVTAATKLTIKGKTAVFSDLKESMTARVWGVLNRNNSDLSATKVNVTKTP